MIVISASCDNDPSFFVPELNSLNGCSVMSELFFILEEVILSIDIDLIVVASRDEMHAVFAPLHAADLALMLFGIAMGDGAATPIVEVVDSLGLAAHRHEIAVAETATSQIHVGLRLVFLHHSLLFHVEVRNSTTMQSRQ